MYDYQDCKHNRYNHRYRYCHSHCHHLRRHCYNLVATIIITIIIVVATVTTGVITVGSGFVLVVVALFITIIINDVVRSHSKDSQ